MNLKQLFFLLVTTGTFLSCIGCGDGSSGNDLDYIAIGASDAVGIGATPQSNGYVFRIRDSVSEQVRSVALINLGIPGAESDQTLDELEIAEDILGLADFVTIFLGGNDITSGRSVESFESDINSILSLAKNEFQGSIYIATLPDLTQLPKFIDDPDSDVTLARVNAYNEAIRRQAIVHGVTVVELSDLEYTADRVSEDGFHPSDEGYRVIAERFLAVMLPDLIAKYGTSTS